jgi:hypothetical protein
LQLQAPVHSGADPLLVVFGPPSCPLSQQNEAGIKFPDEFECAPTCRPEGYVSKTQTLGDHIQRKIAGTYGLTA